MSSITEVEPLNTASRTASFQGVWVPLVTPFDEEGPDLFSLRRLMRQYRDAGVDGVVVCGSTGEAAAMDEYEQLAVLDTVLDEAGALPVVMGLAGNHQRDVLRRQAVFNTRGLAGLLTPAPYYVRPGQAGLADYFRALADASAVPFILYDIPYRTGEHIDIDTLLVLAEHPNIRAVKDCGGSLDKTQALIAHGGLQVLAGEDMQMLGTLAMGGQRFDRGVGPCAGGSFRGHVSGHAGAAGGVGASDLSRARTRHAPAVRRAQSRAPEGFAGASGRVA